MSHLFTNLFASRRLSRSRKVHARRLQPNRPLRLEPLEDRFVPSTITVTTLSDETDANDGLISLREAITSADAQLQPSFINFAVTGTINLTNALPALSGNITIDGPNANLLTVRRASGGNYGIFVVSPNATVSIFDLTIADSFGGSGIKNQGMLKVSGCTLSHNLGGGLQNTGTVAVSDSTFANNGNSRGGGIWNTGTMSVTNCTFSGNGAALGGAIYNEFRDIVGEPFGSATIAYTTITNSTGYGILILANDPGTFVLNDTLVAGDNSNQDVLGAVDPSSAHNLIGDGNGMTGISDGINGNLVGHSFLSSTVVPIDPRLGPLQNNGGPTFTCALLPGSPALDQGAAVANGPSFDQRGFARVKDLSFMDNANGGDGSDIGSYELQSLTRAVLTVNTTGDEAIPDGSLSLREALLVSTGALPLSSLTPQEQAQIVGQPAGSEVIQLAAGGTITLGSALPAVSNNISIQGPGAASLVVQGPGVVVGMTPFPLFSVSPYMNVSLSGMTIANGIDHGILSEGILTVDGCTIANNLGDSQGGGILNELGRLKVNNSTLTGNSAANGGGIFNAAGGSLGLGIVAVNNSTLAANTANRGAGIYSGTGDAVTMINSTISGNSAAIDGGGLYLDASTATLSYVTLANNRANTANSAGVGGGIRNIPSIFAVHLDHSIVAGNWNLGAVSTTPDDVAGQVDPASLFNLIGWGAGMTGISTGSNGNRVGSTTRIDPLLGPLQNNGGPTMTQALLPGSPAIDKGINPNPPATDQRGCPRVANFVSDLGAYEVQVPMANAGGPYAITEGQPLQLDASASSDPDPASALSYSWRINGKVVASGVKPTLTWAQLTAAGVGASSTPFSVAVLISDNYRHLVASPSVNLTVADAALAAQGNTLCPALRGFVSGLLATFTDAYPAAVASDFTATINWSDGDTTASYTIAPAGPGQFVLTATKSHPYTSGGSKTITVTIRDSGGSAATAQSTADIVTHFGVSAPSAATAGTPFAVTVTALDAAGNVTPGYLGTVHFASSDTKALLPANYTFTATDQGIHSFTVTLVKAGAQSITAADTVASSLKGSQAGIVVSPAATSQFKVTAPTSSTAGIPVTLTLTAQDAYGNTTPAYLGTAHFTSTDAKALLPGNYPFVAGDKGVHVFASAATCFTAGTRNLTATDTVTASITGQQAITVKAAAATAIVVSGYPSPDTAGTTHAIFVTAKDAFGNVATGYRGQVHF